MGSIKDKAEEYSRIYKFADTPAFIPAETPPDRLQIAVQLMPVALELLRALHEEDGLGVSAESVLIELAYSLADDIIEQGSRA